MKCAVICLLLVFHFSLFAQKTTSEAVKVLTTRINEICKKTDNFINFRCDGNDKISPEAGRYYLELDTIIKKNWNLANSDSGLKHIDTLAHIISLKLLACLDTLGNEDCSYLAPTILKYEQDLINVEHEAEVWQIRREHPDSVYAHVQLDTVLTKSDSVAIINITNMVANNYAKRYSHDIDSISRYYVKEIDSVKSKLCVCDSAAIKPPSPLLQILEYVGTPVCALVLSYFGGYAGAHH